MMKRIRLGGLALMLTMAFVATMGSGAPVSAQDATPEAATPTAAECVSPGMPPGTPTAMDDMDMASPEAMDDMDMMASPEAIAVPEGTPADEETAAAITAAIENYAACYNEGQATGDPGLYVALETPNYWMSMGYDNPYDYIAEEGAGGTVEIQGDITNQMTYDDGRVSGDVQILLNGHWLSADRLYLVQEGDIWKVDEDLVLPVSPDDAETVSVNGVSLTEATDESTGEITYAFEFLGSTDIEQTEALVFNFTNNGEELHEAVVVQLPEGTDPLGLLDGSVSFEDVTFYGGVFGVAPGQTQDLVLMNMETGTYTMLCFFPGPDGSPHAAHGMVAEFNIVAAES
jgi:uncharacterized cupredoxin-like copper-binding protein